MPPPPSAASPQLPHAAPWPHPNPEPKALPTGASHALDYACVSRLRARDGRKPHLLPSAPSPGLSPRWGQTHLLLPLIATLSVTPPSAPSPATSLLHPLCPGSSVSRIVCLLDPLCPASPLPASSFPPALLEPWLNVRLLEQKQTCLNARPSLASLPAPPPRRAIRGRVSALLSGPHLGLLGATGFYPLSSLQLPPSVRWALAHTPC